MRIAKYDARMMGILALVAVALVPALGTAEVRGPHVTVALVAETASLQPGRDLAAGVRFDLEPGWHVYWRNPGDSGEAPKIAWELPAGFQAGDIAWPAPGRIPVGPLANYGYDKQVLLATTLAVPKNLATSSVDLRVEARWLVCNEDACIPGSAPLSLTLPVDGSEPRPSKEAPLFAETRTRLPVGRPESWRVSASADGESLTLAVRGAADASDPPLFFPFDQQVIEPAAPQVLERSPEGFTLRLVRGQSRDPLASLDGVLTIGKRAYTLSAPVPGAGGWAFFPLLLAFAGGLLLNVMPCVFPVLAIKAFALLGTKADARREVRAHGLAYTLGVLVSFWALAAILIAVRAGGAPLGWGFQLQSPAVVAGLAAVFFWMALLLLDVTSIGGSLMGVGNRLTTSGGSRGAFFTGVLATIVATPCSAPFMGTALGYALVQPAAVALAVFTALGLGLASPYLLLTFVPRLGALLPRPGAWMDTVKQLLAFPLLGTVAWLTWVASVQSGPAAVAAMLAMLLLLGFAAWAARYGSVPRVVALAAVIAALVVGGSIERVDTPEAHAGWEPYSSSRLGQYLAAGRPVFVDFTAAWCVTCQVNERLVLARPAVQERMRQLGVVAVRADWTTPDPDITRALQRFGRDGVPLYVLYTGRGDEPPRILPQLLTTEIVMTELEKLERRSST